MSSKNSKSRSNAPTGTEATNAEGNAESTAAAVILDATATPPGSSVPGGTNTGAADGTADAHDQVGEAAAVSPADLAAALALTGCADFADLVATARTGAALEAAIAEYTGAEGPLKDWAAADNPVDFADDLVAEIVLLRSQAADRVKAEKDASAEKAAGSAIEPAPEFDALYPLTAAALAAFEAAHGRGAAATVRITSARDGFRRAGLIHSRAQRDYPLTDLSPEQVETFLADPVLTVELV